MFTITKMKFDSPDGVTHEIDFKDNEDKFKEILKANNTGTVISLQVKIQDKIYRVLSNQLYF